MNLSLDELITAVKGRPVLDYKRTLFKGVSIDSRNISNGDLFIALKGDRFDGHDFVEEALKKGALGAVMEGVPETVSPFHFQDKALVLAEDTLKALGDLASFWREKQKIKVVAISGSCGKTTTKEMAASVLSFSYEVLKTEGNLNNLIGLPLTILRIRDYHDIPVLELGVSEMGEMRRLGEIASPDIALLTNIGKAHLGGFKDLNVVAREKRELFKTLGDGGTAVINMDDPLIAVMTEGLKGERITYGREGGSDVVLESYDIKGPEFIEFVVSIRGKRCKGQLNVLGVQNLLNALSAIAIAFSLNVDWEEIREGLISFVPLKGRMQMVSLSDEITVIDDTYNANPSSMETSLKTLTGVKGNGRRIAVLGDMLDLGEEVVSAHRDIGRLVKSLEVDHLFSIGRYGEELARGAVQAGMEEGKVKVAESREDIMPELLELIKKRDWILIKGSRGVGMESIVDNLKDYFKYPKGQTL